MSARLAFMACVLTLGLLSGCAMPRMIDSEVQSFTTGAAAVAPASYRFERLPSQAASASQDVLEGMARQALAKVGLGAVPAGAEASARYAVQLQLQITSIPSPYLHGGAGVGFWGRHGSVRGSWLDISMEPPWTRHAVRLILRDTANGQVAFETSASFDGPWGDSRNLLPPILDAALQGYPNPPSGARKVVIELPPPGEQEP